MHITVLHESRGLHPLSWIHRAEAGSVAAELRRAGHVVRLEQWHPNSLPKSAGPFLLRLSDPVMSIAVQEFTRAALGYIGPSAGALDRCYDKYEAWRIATANGIDCPATMLAHEPGAIPFPLVLKPRHGSDSIGVRILGHGPIPQHARTDHYIAQEHVPGVELTVAALQGIVGAPLKILLPEGKPYSFFRKYLMRPRRVPLGDDDLAVRVRRLAAEIARVFDVGWAARIDLIHETETDRLCFLECDAAPLIGTHSAFAASLQAGGIDRSEQLRLLLSQNSA